MPCELWSRLRGRLRRPTYKSTSQSIFATLIGQGTLVISGICAARLLGVHGRGTLALLVLIPTVITLIGTAGIPIAVTFYIAKDQEHARAIVLRLKLLGLIQVLVLLAIQCGAVLLLYASASVETTVAAASTVLLIPSKLAQDYGLGILQGRQHFRSFNILRVAPLLAYATCTLVLFVIDFNHLLAVTLCFVLSTLIVSIVTSKAALASLPSTDLSDAGDSPSLRQLTSFGLKSLLGAVYPSETFQVEPGLRRVVSVASILGYVCRRYGAYQSAKVACPERWRNCLSAYCID